MVTGIVIGNKMINLKSWRTLVSYKPYFQSHRYEVKVEVPQKVFLEFVLFIQCARPAGCVLTSQFRSPIAGCETKPCIPGDTQHDSESVREAHPVLRLFTLNTSPNFLGRTAGMFAVYSPIEHFARCILFYQVKKSWISDRHSKETGIQVPNSIPQSFCRWYPCIQPPIHMVLPHVYLMFTAVF